MKTKVSTSAILGLAALAWLVIATSNQGAGNVAAGPAMEARPTRVAVIDLVRVFDTCEQTKVLSRQFEARTKTFLEEGEAKGRQLQGEMEALRAFAPDTADWYRQNKAARQMQFNNELWRQMERDDIGENHKRWVLRTYSQIVAETERVAKARGIDVVLTREQIKSEAGDSQALMAQILSIKVVYASQGADVDITEEVLAHTNAAFEKAGGAASVDFNK